MDLLPAELDEDKEISFHIRSFLVNAPSIRKIAEDIMTKSFKENSNIQVLKTETHFDREGNYFISIHWKGPDEEWMTDENDEQNINRFLRQGANAWNQAP